jgi:hypothetical protein
MALKVTSPEDLMFVLSSLEANLQNEDITAVGRGGGGRRRKKGANEEEEELKGKSTSTSRKILHAYK